MSNKRPRAPNKSTSSNYSNFPTSVISLNFTLFCIEKASETIEILLDEVSGEMILPPTTLFVLVPIEQVSVTGNLLSSALVGIFPRFHSWIRPYFE